MEIVDAEELDVGHAALGRRLCFRRRIRLRGPDLVESKEQGHGQDRGPEQPRPPSEGLLYLRLSFRLVRAKGLTRSSGLPDYRLGVLRREHGVAASFDEREARQVVAITEEGPVYVHEVDGVVARSRCGVVRVGIDGYGEDLDRLDVIRRGARGSSTVVAAGMSRECLASGSDTPRRTP